LRLRTVAILRGHDPRSAADLAASCWDVGIDLVEVPVQGEAGWSALHAVAARAEGGLVGAGTVLSTADVRRAVDLGASVIISPGIDEEVVRATQERGALPLPGVMTATDVSVASRLGLRASKLFPASLVGPAWLDAMRGPFPGMAYVAVGGIGVENAREFLDAGAAGVAFGSSIERVLSLDDPRRFVSGLHDRVAAGA
jgi:2-dehydro-3-deoxyphosphogluconate aldolase / (4S)-4-hydroxy-2-oxoglutarate aldolase